MIVHARARTDSERDSAIIASPALGMLAGALAIHATLVTRANGVWASVHSFVGNEEAREYNDPYIRIVQLFDDGAAGLEVAGIFPNYDFTLFCGILVVSKTTRQTARFIFKDFDANGES